MIRILGATSARARVLAVVALLALTCAAVVLSRGRQPDADAKPAAPAVGPAPETPHLAAHRRLMTQYQQAEKAGSEAVLAFANAQRDQTRALAADDARRVDADELTAMALIRGGRWTEASRLAASVVRARRRATPPEPELVALALMLQATTQAALDHEDEADRTAQDALASYRAAYGPQDLRLAEQLEANANLLQSEFGRLNLVIKELREAVEIRSAVHDGSGIPLALSLKRLAIHESMAGQYGEALDHLATADSMLAPKLAAGAGDDRLATELGEVLVLRAGILSRLARHDEAQALFDRCGNLEFDDTAHGLAALVLVLEGRASAEENRGDLRAALASTQAVLDLGRKHSDLVASGELDKFHFDQAELTRAELQMATGDLAAAEASLQRARTVLGESEQVLLDEATIKRRAGDDAAALDLARRALALRKERVSEFVVHYGTTRRLIQQAPRPPEYSGQSASTLSFGEARVLVPGGDQTRHGWLRPADTPPIPVGPATNADRLWISSVDVSQGHDGSDPWAGRLKPIQSTARFNADSALIFIHGFNNTFEQAVRRVAQLARDLNFDGPVFLFTWPSKGSFLRYGTDRDTANASSTALKEFLDAVAASTSASTRLHIVAHSMGNRVLLPALEAAVANPALRPRIGEVVFAAPAVPIAEFRRHLDTIAAVEGAPHMTLYASQADRALRAGLVREGIQQLAGDVVGGEPFVHDGLDSIDITAAATGDWLDLNHDVFASNPVMDEDMRLLFSPGQRRAPDQRLSFLRSRAGEAQVWVYALPKSAPEASRAGAP